MSANNLQAVADQLVRLAQRQGYVVEHEVREEMTRAGLPEQQWKDALALARPPLSYRRGRYYHSGEPVAASDIQAAVARLVTEYQNAAARVERREQGRVDFVQPVQVVSEDGHTWTLLTRDLSATGVRLIGTRRLLGQKVRVVIPVSGATVNFTVRILWTCPVGEDLIENGGTFLSVTGGSTQ